MRLSGWGPVTPLDKSVFLRDRQGSGFGYGKNIRDPNSPNMDKGILKVNWNFETIEQRNVLGRMAIHVGDLLISGGVFLPNTFPREWTENSRWVSTGEIKRPICA